MGVPIEELMFGVSLGMMWSGFYEHVFWYHPVSDPTSD